MSQKACIYTMDQEDGDNPNPEGPTFSKAGEVRVVSGRAVASSGVKWVTDQRNGPVVLADDNETELTPADGDSYVTAIPTALSNSSRAYATLEED